MEISIKKYVRFEYHPVCFESEEVNLKNIEKEILNLNTKKAVASNRIPAKVLKETFDISSPVLQQI